MTVSTPAFRVLVTRPADQAGPWVERLRAAGIDAVALPLIGIHPPEDPVAVRDAWRRRAAFDLMMFVSPNAAGQFFAQALGAGTGPHADDGNVADADANADAEPSADAHAEGLNTTTTAPAAAVAAAWPPALRAAAPGPGTAEVLRRCGVPAAQVIEPAPDSPQFDSEALWRVLGPLGWAGRRALIVRGEGGRDWLAEQLRAQGAEVQFVSAYRRGVPRLDAAAQGLLDTAIAAPQRHLWFFSSSEAVDHLADLLDQHPRADARLALHRAQAVATHPRIAQRAAALGFAAVRGCRPGVESVVACIQSGETHAGPGVPPPSP